LIVVYLRSVQFIYKTSSDTENASAPCITTPAKCRYIYIRLYTP